jgi:DNA polymerase-1
VPGVDYEWVGNIHDEFQAEVKIEHAEFVGRIVADSIRKSGEHFKFRCPLAGNFDIGETWADTH